MTAAFVFAFTVVAVIIFCRWMCQNDAHSRPERYSMTPSRMELLFRRIDEWEATPNSGSFYDFCFESAYKNVAD
jgi:hypothetical protein